VIAVGYSMGGPVASLLWRRHPEVVAGLVLCATWARLPTMRRGELRFAALGGAALGARLLPSRLLAGGVARVFDARRTAGPTEGWAAEELRRNDWTAILEAGRALGTYDARPWIGQVDVPTAVVTVMQDDLVPAERQLALARSIPDATVFPVQGNHVVCVAKPAQFTPVLLDAVGSVADRIRARAD
jgi:3-oxoadipate enol-lactonase